MTYSILLSMKATEIKETEMTLEEALLKATENNRKLLISNPNRYARKSFLRRTLNNRHGKPMVRINDFWHEVTGYEIQIYSNLVIFYTTANEQYKPII